MKGKRLFTAIGSATLAAALICTNLGVSSLFAAGTQEVTDANVFFATPTADNPLGGASDFNGVIFGNLSGFADSEGPVASSGNVDVTHQVSYPPGNLYLSHSPGSWIPYDDIDDGIAPAMNVGLILGETVDKDGNVHTGSCAKNVDSGTVIVGPTSSYTGASYPKKYENNESADKFMQDAKANLTYQNAVLFSKAENGRIIRNAENTPEWEALKAYRREVIVFKGTDSDWNVFKVNFDDVAAMSAAIWVYDVPEGSKVLMNITASGKSLTVTQGSNGDMLNFFPSDVCAVPYLGKSLTDKGGRMATAEFAGRVLWNVDPKITKVTYRMGSNYIMGSLLAPNADLNTTGSDGSSSVNGTLVINNATGTGGSELHWFKFRGKAGGTGDVSETTTAETTTAPASTPETEVTTTASDSGSGTEVTTTAPVSTQETEITTTAPVTTSVSVTKPTTTMRPPMVITGTTAPVTTPKVTAATTKAPVTTPSAGTGSMQTSVPNPDRPSSDVQTIPPIPPVDPDDNAPATTLNPAVSDDPSGDVPTDTVATGAGIVVTSATGNNTSNLDLGAGVEDFAAAESGNTGIIVLAVCGLGAVCALALGKAFRRKAK